MLLAMNRVSQPVKKLRTLASNATNRTFVWPGLSTTPKYIPVQFQLHMLQLDGGNGCHVIRFSSTGSVVMYAPSSALLMVKGLQCMHARMVCATDL